MREAHRNDYYVLEHDAALRVAFLRRTPLPFPDLDTAQRNHDDLRQALVALAADKLVLDLREGPPGRNDAAFERAVQGTRQELAQKFKRVAVLVRTAAGRLQMQRLAREGGVPIPVFLDENEALAFLAK